MKRWAAVAVAIIATCASTAAFSPQGAARDTANTVSLDPNSPDSYRAFAPELAQTVSRVPKIDPQRGVYAGEVKPDLFWVTDGIYQAAFLRSCVLAKASSFSTRLPVSPTSCWR
jgi:hypothetical protein